MPQQPLILSGTRTYYTTSPGKDKVIPRGFELVVFEDDYSDVAFIVYGTGNITVENLPKKNFNAQAISSPYANVSVMIAAQVGQSQTQLLEVTDASADAGITSGRAWYRYLGTTNGNLTDYIRVSKEEDLTGSGGSANVFESGLTKTGSNVRLNGTLLENVTLNLAGFDFAFRDNVANYELLSIRDDLYQARIEKPTYNASISMGSAQNAISIQVFGVPSSNVTALQLTEDAGIRVWDQLSSLGLVGVADYSAGATNFSYIQKIYVDQQIAAIQTGANGLHPPVQNIAALQALDTTVALDYPDKWMILVEDDGTYRFDRDSSATVDLPRVVAPTTGPGRWFKVSSILSSHNLLDFIQGGQTDEHYHLTAAQHTIAVATEAALTNALVALINGALQRTIAADTTISSDNSLRRITFNNGPVEFALPNLADFTVTVGTGNEITHTVTGKASLRMQNGTWTELSPDANFKGAADYRGNYVDFSYIQRIYAIDTFVQINNLESTVIPDRTITSNPSGTVTLNFNNTRYPLSYVGRSISQNLTFAFSNANNRTSIKLSLEITGAARTFTFPSSVKAVTSAVSAITGASWNSTDQILTLPVGLFEVGIDFDGVNDFLKVVGPYE